METLKPAAATSIRTRENTLHQRWMMMVVVVMVVVVVVVE
jgi:hypothetical protein